MHITRFEPYRSGRKRVDAEMSLGAAGKSACATKLQVHVDYFIENVWRDFDTADLQALRGILGLSLGPGSLRE